MPLSTVKVPPFFTLGLVMTGAGVSGSDGSGSSKGCLGGSVGASVAGIVGSEGSEGSLGAVEGSGASEGVVVSGVSEALDFVRDRVFISS